MAVFYHILRDTTQPGTQDEGALARSLSPRERELLGRVYAAEWKRESLAGLTTGTVEETITDLYLDPANGLVEWGPMLQLAVARLRSTPWPTIERGILPDRRVPAGRSR